MTKTMLIVDDGPKIVQSCRNYLTAAGFNVVRAETGPTGLATARQDRPDLIVLDLLLPGMDGLDVCRHFRQDPLLSNIPIIVLTARVEETGNACTRASGGARFGYCQTACGTERGMIGVEWIPGKGARFWFRLPAV